LGNDEKWNFSFYESRKIVVFNGEFLFLMVNMTLIY